MAGKERKEVSQKRVWSPYEREHSAFAVAVSYDIQLGKGKAKEYYGPWKTKEEAEAAAQDTLEGKITCTALSKVPVVECEVITVGCKPRFGMMLVPVALSQPYLGPL